VRKNVHKFLIGRIGLAAPGQGDQMFFVKISPNLVTLLQGRIQKYVATLRRRKFSMTKNVSKLRTCQ
jgi:hypothetical protein